MKTKVGILIHPGWSTISSDNNAEMMDEYIRYIKRFDTVIIYHCSVNIGLRLKYIRMFCSDIIKYYLYGKEFIVDDIACPIRKDGIKTFLDELTAKVKTPKRYRNSIALGKFNLEHRLNKLFRSKYVEDLMATEFSGILFDGDYGFMDKFEQHMDKFKSLKIDNVNIIQFSHGGIQYVNMFAKPFYEHIEIGVDTEITLFGEYYNQCVIGHSALLDHMNIKHEIDKTMCVYNTAEYLEHDTTLDLECFKSLDKTVRN